MKEKDKISYLFEEAVNFFNQGDYRSAVQAWEKILEYDPDNAQATGGIRIAKERMQDEGGSGEADTTPEAGAEPTPPADPQESSGEAGQEATAAGGDEGLSFNLGDEELGDPFADEASSPEAPTPSRQTPPAASESEALDAWGLPAEEGEPEEAPESVPLAPPAEDSSAEEKTPGTQGPDTLPPVDDLGEMVEEGATLPPGGEGGDDLGWEEEPAEAAAGGEAADLDELEDLGDLDDLGEDFGSVGDLEDLELPPMPEDSGDEGGFEERDEPDTIPPGAEEVPDSDDIPLGGPPEPPPLPSDEEDEDIEDLEEDLGLEPDDSSIPLAQPVPRPAPAPVAVKRSGGLGLPVLILLALLVVGGGAWAALSFLGGGESPDDGPGNVTGNADGGPTPTDASLVACWEASTAWKRGDIAAAAAQLDACRQGGKPADLNQATWTEIQTFAPIVTRLAERPVQYRRRFYNAVYRDFCRDRDYRAAFTDLRELLGQFPQFAGEIRPVMGQIHFNLGFGELEAENPREAIYYFERTLEFLPGDAEAQTMLRFSQQYRDARPDSAYRAFLGDHSERREGCI